MKRALVLGASKKDGTGWTIAKALAAQDLHVTVGARSKTGIEELAQLINGTAITCDVLKEQDIENIAQKAVSPNNEKIDFAVLVAGEGMGGDIDSISDDQLHQTFQLNYFAAVYFLRHVARNMTDGGSIILMSTIAAARPWPGYFSYGCAKAALETLVKYAALEYAPRGIRVNAVAPGPIQTPESKSRHNSPGIKAVMGEEIPLGRTVLPEEVAQSIIWLGLNAPWVTGETIHIDGGMHLRRPPDPEKLKAAATAGS